MRIRAYGGWSLRSTVAVYSVVACRFHPWPKLISGVQNGASARRCPENTTEHSLSSATLGSGMRVWLARKYYRGLEWCIPGIGSWVTKAMIGTSGNNGNLKITAFGVIDQSANENRNASTSLFNFEKYTWIKSMYVQGKEKE